MKEEYLHHLWQYKKLSFHHFTSVEGEEVQVVNPGWLNVDSGPDFFSGSVIIGGMKWTGNIELHINSSDWYKHNHHKDKAYDNVVLHVVYNHDQDVFVNNRKLPTIEIKSYIDKEHLNKYQTWINTKRSRPCSALLLQAESIGEQMENALFQRLTRKASEMLRIKETFSLTNAAIFELFIAQAFGGRANKDAFRELSLTFPDAILQREKWNPIHIESLVFGSAGFLEMNRSSIDEYHYNLMKEWKHLKLKYNLHAMNKAAWKFSGMRPPSFPSVRLAQYANFLVRDKTMPNLNADATAIREEFYSLFEAVLPSYWHIHYDFGKRFLQINSGEITRSFKDQLLINGLAPFLVFYGQLKNDFSFIDKALNILELIPAEQNSIIKSWKKDGIEPKNANQSQALLELNNEFCTFRRCLGCKIGQELLLKR
jgi:hypothetical protein